jgi:ribosomal protein S18
MALKAIGPEDHMRRGSALVELGDWYLSGGLPNRGLAAYRRAWKEFEQGGSVEILAAPRQLAYRPPLAAVSRAKGDHDNMEEHFVEVRFTVTSEGRTSEVTAADTDASSSQQKAVLAAIRRARYAPRLEGGEPVETTGVEFRERLLSKKQ